MMANATEIKFGDPSRTFQGVAYCDAGWPGPPVLDQAVDLDDSARAALVAERRQTWQQAPV